jgi:hypothetical protein
VLFTPLSALSEAIGANVIAIASALALPVVCRLAELISGEPRPRAVLLGGVLAVVPWVELCTTYTHPEDIGVVLGALVALWAHRSGRPVVLGLAVGLAASGKPWAVGLLALTLAPNAGRRWVAPLTAVLAAGLPWLPFVVQPGTLSALTSSTANVFPESALALAGLADEVYPSSLRLTQFALCLLVVLVAARRNRPEVALFACAAARLLLEPQVWDYHWATLVAGALLVDVIRDRDTLPWLSAVLFATYQLSREVAPEITSLAQALPFCLTVVLLAAPRGRRFAAWAPLPRPRRGGAREELLAD